MSSAFSFLSLPLRPSESRRRVEVPGCFVGVLGILMSSLPAVPLLVFQAAGCCSLHTSVKAHEVRAHACGGPDTGIQAMSVAG